MELNEYNAWRATARKALSAVYSELECAAIMSFFDSITGSDEYELTGPDMQEAIGVIRDELTKATGFSMYHDLMVRVWIYAPLILKHAEERG